MDSRNLVAGGVVVLLALGVGVWLARRGPDKEHRHAASPTTMTSETQAETPPPPDVSPREEDWRRKREQIRRARAERNAPAPTPEPPTEADRCDAGCEGTLQLSIKLAAAVEGCAELLPEGAAGQVRYEAHVIAEPGVGAVVDTVEVTDDAGLGSDAFNECMIESARLAELADPKEPVSDTFAFRWTAGARGDNAKDFLTDNPDVLTAHPELQRLLQAAADAPPSGEDATLFAKTISEDEAAAAAFLRWTADQGVDLSQVHVPD